MKQMQDVVKNDFFNIKRENNYLRSCNRLKFIFWLKYEVYKYKFIVVIFSFF